MNLKKTELYVEGRQIDLYGDEAFLLNFNIADISDISAKTTSYSKEVDIPATKINNQIFSHLFDVSSEGYFNPISKKTTELFIDGVCVMRGYFKLNSITIIDNEYVTYHGVIFEDSINFISALGDLELSNLYLPLTGTTSTTGLTTGTITLDDYFGTNYNAVIQNNGGGGQGGGGGQTTSRRYHTNNNGLSMTGGVFGQLETIPKSVSIVGSSWAIGGTPGGLATTPTINAFVAAFDQQISLTANMRFNVPETYKFHWIKATPNANGTWTHTTLQSGTGPTIGTGSSATITASTVLNTTISPAAKFPQNQPTHLLLAGQAIYLVVVRNNTVSPTGAPLSINPALSSVTGTSTSVTVQVTNNLLIDEAYVLNNVATATGSTNSDICFPLVDYNQTYPFSATNITLSNQTEAGRNQVKVKFDDLRPAVFVKRVWDAIFQQSGFKYKSKFLDTNADLFKKLIVIGGMEEDEVVTNQFEAVYTGSTGTGYTITEPIQDKDLPNSANITSYEYNALLFGGRPNAVGTNYWKINNLRYSYVEFLKKTFTYANASNLTTHGYSGADYGYVLKALVAGRYTVDAQLDATSLPVLYGVNTANTAYQGLTYRLKIEVLKGGSYINDPSLFTKPSKSQWVEKKVVTFKRAANTLNQDFRLNINETVELERGDLCRVILLASAEAQMDPNNSDATGYFSKTILKFGTTYIKYGRCGTWMGQTVDNLTYMLPRNMKQKDFILGLAKMFNLYFEPDKQDQKTIYIEPRDAYYEDGRVLNWEKKLDYSKALDISILSHDQPKNYVFKYMDDSTDYNTEQYKKFTPNGLNFGSYKFTSPNEYTTETDEFELPFAASYLEKINGTEPLQDLVGLNGGPMVITKIIDPESQKPGYNGDPAEWKKEPRILIYGGKIALPDDAFRPYDFYLTSIDSEGDEFRVEFSHYGYAGHYDKPIEPTFDLNFYSDTHYLPSSYWNNVVGNIIQTTSTTSVNLSTLTIGQNIVMSKGTNAYFNVNTAVNKYVRVYQNTTGPLTNYFEGLVISNTSTTVTLKVTFKVGTATINNWKMVLLNVELKNNLYTTFYKNQMIELTDQTARLMTCYINLTPTDIANFRFNDIVYAHKEYWRVNKIVDYDTSSDVTQTTKVELIKIIRANTNTLIDYIQGGYLGIAGGTGGGVTTGNGTLNGVTPSVVALGPIGNPVQYSLNTVDTINQTRNSIILNAEGLAPTYFDKGVDVFTGTNDIRETLSQQFNAILDAKETADNKPIGDSITYEDKDAGNIIIDGRYSQVYFDVEARNVLFIMTLQDVAANDGFTVNFDALNDTTTTFMQIENGNATSNAIFIINSCNSVIAKYDATKEKWIISRG
jgi:hypothetical protein